jgi:hypothetical protein
MKRTCLLSAAAFVLVAAAATAAFAAIGYPMQCTSCGFSARVQIGGIRRFERMTAYCADCKKFVYIQWERGAKKPEPIAKVWDSASGESLDVFKCPECSKPVLPLRSNVEQADGPGFDRCPKCGKKTFQVDKKQGIIMVD